MLGELDSSTYTDLALSLKVIKEFKDTSNLNIFGWIEQFRYESFEKKIQAFT